MSHQIIQNNKFNPEVCGKTTETSEYAMKADKYQLAPRH